LPSGILGYVLLAFTSIFAPRQAMACFQAALANLYYIYPAGFSQEFKAVFYHFQSLGPCLRRGAKSGFFYQKTFEFAEL